MLAHQLRQLFPERLIDEVKTQLTVQPGLKLRLDLIDKTFREELAKLMGEHADRIMSELGISVEKPVAAPPGQLFKPA